MTPPPPSRWCVLSAAALAVWGCAEGGGERSAGGPGGTSGTGGASFAGAPSGGVGADAGSFVQGDGNTPPVEACATEVRQAEPTPVDMYVMLDASGSMTEPVQGNIAKWDAVATAISRFLQDPRSAGLGVGMQFFPYRHPVPIQCTTDQECGPAAPCAPIPGFEENACATSQELIWCVSDSDCGAEGPCLPAGVCELTDATGAAYVCSLGTRCRFLGNCVEFPRRCENETLCDPAIYEAPAVPITLLPDGAISIVDAMNARVADPDQWGQTPTGPALQGAIDYASGWASSHSDHVTVVVLATDGLPTDCSPTDIASVANIALTGLNGNPSIQTYVIGVFGSDDTESPGNLAQIANAGGTGQPFIVDVGGDVTEQFMQALNSIRGSALSCEFQVPAPPEGETLDYFKVNLDFTTGGQTRELVYVEDPARCADVADGWHYNVDPSSAETPTTMVVCPAVCDEFRTAFDGLLNVVMGCETRIFIQ